MEICHEHNLLKPLDRAETLRHPRATCGRRRLLADYLGLIGSTITGSALARSATAFWQTWPASICIRGAATGRR